MTTNDNETSVFDDLDEKDRSIVMIKVDNPTSSLSDIAEELGMSKTQIQRRLAKQKVKDAIAELQMSALQILVDGQVVAAFSVSGP